MAQVIGQFSFGDRCATLRLGGDSLWAVIEGPRGFEVALRCAWAAGAQMEVKANTKNDIWLRSSFGDYRITVHSPASDILHVTARLTPALDLVAPAWPRDLYILDRDGDPTKAQGEVFAAQRGFNTALVYGKIDSPTDTTFFYLQDLTSLNDYFNATGTKPDGVVGGKWPELGYQGPSHGDSFLPQSREITVSDAFLRLRSKAPDDPRAEGRIFLEHLAAIYPHIQRPDTTFHDWRVKAEATVADLGSELATVKDAGYTYVQPYVGAEPPDSMAQVAVLLAVHEHGRWRNKAHPIEAELRAGLYRFYAPEVGAVRRYLNTVGPGKDPDEVDSWYLCHPLRGLASLAMHGDEGALDLFTASLQYAIQAAHHFEYAWPIQFSLKDFEVKKLGRQPGQPGQTDAGGLYAYVMLDAHELTGDALYLEEAKRSIYAMDEMHFEVAYQTNLTSWGAVACARLWRATGDRFFLDQADVLLSSVFHNSAMWQSKIGRLADVPTFLGVTCLHDAPYLAPFECYETFTAISEILAIAGEEMSQDKVLLLTQHWKYALNRLWWFYPSSLKESWVAHTTRSGQVVRRLEFPVEDLYVDGQPVGQVGQEVYGAGGALVAACRSFHSLPGGGHLFCDHPIAERESKNDAFRFRVFGHPAFPAKARVLGREGESFKIDGKAVKGEEFSVPIGPWVEIRPGRLPSSPRRKREH